MTEKINEDSKDKKIEELKDQLNDSVGIINNLRNRLDQFTDSPPKGCPTTCSDSCARKGAPYGRDEFGVPYQGMSVSLDQIGRVNFATEAVGCKLREKLTEFAKDRAETDALIKNTAKMLQEVKASPAYKEGLRLRRAKMNQGTVGNWNQRTKQWENGIDTQESELEKFADNSTLTIRHTYQEKFSETVKGATVGEWDQRNQHWKEGHDRQPAIASKGLTIGTWDDKRKVWIANGETFDIESLVDNMGYLRPQKGWVCEHIQMIPKDEMGLHALCQGCPYKSYPYKNELGFYCGFRKE